MGTVARVLVPHSWRVCLVRWKRMPSMWLERGEMALEKGALDEGFPFVLACHETPLSRPTVPYPPEVQAGKEHNVRLAGRLLNGLVIEPGQTFSWHHAVGPPTAKRGFVPGPEMHDGALTVGLGGGLCSVSNMTYLLALLSGMKVTERHRHELDLFPDHGRTVPFGCGATVFYNLCDLRFVNPHSFPVVLGFDVNEALLAGKVCCRVDPGLHYEVYESTHEMRQESGMTVRENRVRRRAVSPDGQIIDDEEVAHNVARVLYDYGASP